jgi:phenylpyruvate tautomerase PptA (4-oxalocrotonate tautomerase family)
MPLWQIFHPKDAYTAQDKETFSKRITEIYARAPLPEFYVVVIFHETPADNFYVGGKPRDNFVRLKIDQMARTLPNPTYKEWWMRRVEDLIAPFVTDRGYDSEVQIAELGRDLWTMNGMAPPPFESIAEKIWVRENRVIPYTEDEKMPASRRAPEADGKQAT